LVLTIKFLIFKNMRKYIVILAIGVTMTLTACGNGSTTNEATDSTGANVDTTAITVVDTTAQTAGGGAEAIGTENGLKKPSVEEVK
jgi:hypothetical protein